MVRNERGITHFRDSRVDAALSCIPLRVQEPNLSALDVFVSEQSIPRPEAVLRILRHWLTANGYLKV